MGADISCKLSPKEKIYNKSKSISMFEGGGGEGGGGERK